ncbi:hypothetical protein GQR58_021701 [Nymphon striatum]|nr:hypothetical protein GQR58_021701 [Nymphon striatum]
MPAMSRAPSAAATRITRDAREAGWTMNQTGDELIRMMVIHKDRRRYFFEDTQYAPNFNQDSQWKGLGKRALIEVEKLSGSDASPTNHRLSTLKAQLLVVHGRRRPWNHYHCYKIKISTFNNVIRNAYRGISAFLGLLLLLRAVFTLKVGYNEPPVVPFASEGWSSFVVVDEDTANIDFQWSGVGIYNTQHKESAVKEFQIKIEAIQPKTSTYTNSIEYSTLPVRIATIALCQSDRYMVFGKYCFCGLRFA